MTYTLANSAHTNSAGSLGGLTIPATTIGNLGVTGVCYSTDATISAINGGGTWTLIGRQIDAANGQQVEWWWTIFTSSVTAITTTSIDAVTYAYCEFNSSVGFAASPVRTSDATKAYTTTGTGTDAETSNSITPAAGDLVVANFGDTGGNQASITHGTGWTAGVSEIGASGTGASALEWETAAGGSQNATFTVGTAGHNYTVQIAAFAPPIISATPPIAWIGAAG